MSKVLSKDGAEIAFDAEFLDTARRVECAKLRLRLIVRVGIGKPERKKGRGILQPVEIVDRVEMRARYIHDRLSVDDHTDCRHVRLRVTTAEREQNGVVHIAARHAGKHRRRAGDDILKRGEFQLKRHLGFLEKVFGCGWTTD